MTLNVEKECGLELGLDYKEIARAVAERILADEGCPYETEISLLLTSDEEIRVINREQRGIDRATDVLSFPQMEYERPSDFSWAEAHEYDCFNPESGELILGDIVVSLDKVSAQAEKYDHSPRREFAFLIAHSMLHLLGYDHMEADEAAVMEAKQEAVLEKLGIVRDIIRIEEEPDEHQKA